MEETKSLFSARDLTALAALVEDAIEDLEGDLSFSDGVRAEAADDLHALLAKIAKALDE